MNNRVYKKEFFLNSIKHLNSEIKREIRTRKIRKMFKINK